MQNKIAHIGGLLFNFFSVLFGLLITTSLIFSGAQKALAALAVDAGTNKITNHQVSQIATVTGTPPPISFAWTKVSGPGNITFGTPDAKDTTISADQDGSYVLKLTANDGTDDYFGTTDFVWDTTAPTIASITSSATSPGILKIGDTISFILTPEQKEAGASVSGSYNGQVLSWTTADSGITYTATYTVHSGDADQTTPLQITGVVITDAAGNTSNPFSGSDVQKTINANAPHAPCLDPVTSPVNTSSQTITGSADANSLVTISGGSSTVSEQLTGGATHFSILVPLNINATNNLSVTATDAAGNVSSPSTATIVQDSIIPAAPSTPTASVGPFVNAAQKEAGYIINVGLGASGAVAGDTLQLLLDGSNLPLLQNHILTPADITASSVAFTIESSQVSSDGIKSFTARVIDQAGNVGTQSTALHLDYETVAPSVSIITQFPTITNNTTPSAVVNVEAGVNFEIKNGATVLLSGVGTGANQTIVLPTLSDGTYSLDIVATDAAGNTTTVPFNQFVIDTVPPINPVVDPVTSPVNTDSQTITGTAEANSKVIITGGVVPVEQQLIGGATHFSILVPLTINAINNLSITATDTAGNVSSPSLAIIVQDSVPPQVSGVTDGEITNQNLTITFNKGTATLNGNPFLSGSVVSIENVYTLIVTDAAGNITTVHFTIDKTAPTASIITQVPPLSNNNTPSVVIKVELSADWKIRNGAVVLASGVGTGANQTVSFGPLADGTYSLNLVVTDAAGNITIVPFNSFTIDTVSPVVIIVTQFPSITNNTTPSAVVNVEAGVNFKIKNGATILLSGVGTGANQTIVLPTLSDGTYSLDIVATDAAGNTTTVPFNQFVIDTVPPQVSGVTDGEITNQNLTITFNKGTAALNGASFTSGSVVSIENIYTLIVTDAAGNVTTVHFTLATTPPVITVDPTSITTLFGSNYVDAGVTATSDIFGNLTSQIVVTGSVNTFIPGVYTLQYNVTDAAGNQAQVQTRTVTVVLASNQILPGEIITPEKNEVVVPQDFSSDISIFVPINVQNAKLNLSAFLQGTTTKSVVYPGEIKVDVETSSGIVQIVFPANTTISDAASWNGMLDLVNSTSVHSLPQINGLDSTIVAAYEIGAGENPLVFNKPVKMTFKNQKDKLIGFFSGSNFIQITAICSSDNPDLSAIGACKMNVGNDLVVFTDHFTQFVLFTLNPAPTPVVPAAPAASASVVKTAAVTGTLPVTGVDSCLYLYLLLGILSLFGISATVLRTR